MAEPETITLPKSGMVLRKNRHPIFAQNGVESFELTVAGHFGAVTGFDDLWTAEFDRATLGQTTRAACLAWLDARVIELRAALLPPGAFVVSDTPETVERVARAIHAENVAACDGVTEWEDACESVRQFTMCQAGAVLAALRESRP